MKKLICVASLILCFVSTQALAKHTQADAEAMVKKAIELYKAQGKEAAIKAISDPKGEYMKGDLYAFMFDFETVTLAHPANAKLIGKNLNDLKDAEGKPFMKLMTEKAKEGGGWIEYKWSHPETKKIEAKASYVLPIKEDKIYIGAGVYK